MSPPLSKNHTEASAPIYLFTFAHGPYYLWAHRLMIAANAVIAQLLFLQQEDEKDTLYVHQLL